MITKTSVLTLLGLAGLISANLSFSSFHIGEPTKARIINGSPVPVGQARYQAAILYAGRFICGGSIISNRTILTSANCTMQTLQSQYKIRYGNVDRLNATFEANVIKLMSHPKYNSSNFDFNVGLIILEKAINFTANKNVTPIALADMRPATTENLTLTGWGPTYLPIGNGLPGVLHKAEPLKYITNDKCQLEWPKNTTVTANMLCAVSNSSQIGCGQDQGGPLVNVKTGKQYGIYSWGFSGCLNLIKPSVFASVPDLKQWILANLV